MFLSKLLLVVTQQSQNAPAGAEVCDGDTIMLQELIVVCR